MEKRSEEDDGGDEYDGNNGDWDLNYKNKDGDENLSNQNNHINIASVTEFQGVVNFQSSGRKPLLMMKMMMKRPSGYKHYLRQTR